MLPWQGASLPIAHDNWTLAVSSTFIPQCCWKGAPKESRENPFNESSPGKELAPHHPFILDHCAWSLFSLCFEKAYFPLKVFSFAFLHCVRYSRQYSLGKVRRVGSRVNLSKPLYSREFKNYAKQAHLTSNLDLCSDMEILDRKCMSVQASS